MNSIKNPLQIIFLAIKKVLAKKHYKLWFAALTAIFIAAYIFVPVWLTPGNSLGFQLGLLSLRDYVLFIVLGACASLLVLMQVFLFLRKRSYRVSSAAQGGVGVFGAFFGGLLATAACSSCIAAILGFLGAGSIFFILENQPYVVAGAIALVIIGLYFSARKVMGICEDCKVPTQHFQK